MRLTIPFRATAITAALATATSAALAAQNSTASARSVSNPACALLSGAELRSITGLEGYREGSQGDAPSEDNGGRASCQYTGGWTNDVPGVGIVLTPARDGKSYTEWYRATKPRADCTREAVSGVGDLAFIESCANSNPHLYAKVGTSDLEVIMEAKAPATAASVKPTMVALAKSAAAKVR